MSLVSIKNLSAGYGFVEVLRDVSIEIEAREIVAVLGSNGVGKTTLNNALSGLIAPKTGEIIFDGNLVSGKSPSEIVEMGLIHVPEGRKLFPNLTVKDNLELGSYRRGKSERQKNLDEVLAIFPKLAERIGQQAGTLSGGEQQMVAIGRGLMGSPKLLILDEPSLGLSPLLVEQMFELIKRINQQGITILLVEQNVMQSLNIASRAYVIEEGTIAISGEAKALRDNAELKNPILGYNIRVCKTVQGCHCAVNPPSAIITCPVIKEAASDTRNAATLAISSASPNRPSGILVTSSSYRSGVARVLAVIGVAIGPGAMALTPILRSAISSASERVRPFRPAFDAA